MRPRKSGNKRRLTARIAVATAIATVVTGGFWVAGVGQPATQHLSEVIWTIVGDLP